MPISAPERVAELGGMITSVLGGLADPTGGYALLDFPDYSNVGDSLIWLGELAWFDRHVGTKPRYVCTTHGFDPLELRRRLPRGPIYLSGGGNFGDIYPRFQTFRHEVLEAFPDRRIVQLPQTIHFQTVEAIGETRARIRDHGNFVMLVRDHASLAIAREQLGCEAYLCPDMAFAMGPLARPEAPVHDVVALLRTDEERAAGETTLSPGTEGAIVLDWLQPHKRRGLGERIAGRVLRTVAGDHARFAAVARAERLRGMRILGAGRRVITDRLHGHILSVLMDIPHIILDNSYGKLSGFHEAWTKDVHGVSRARGEDASGQDTAIRR